MGIVFVFAGVAAFIAFLSWVVENPSSGYKNKRRRSSGSGFVDSGGWVPMDYGDSGSSGTDNGPDSGGCGDSGGYGGDSGGGWSDSGGGCGDGGGGGGGGD